MSESLVFVKAIARADSALREHLNRRWQSEAGAWHFFYAHVADEGEVEPLSVNSWHDLSESIWKERFSRVFAVEGERGDVLELLDSIREQEGSASRAEPEPVAEPSSADPHQAAIDFRNELLAKGWPDGKRVAEMAGTSVGKNPSQYAARLRSNGSLLGVWDAPERTFRHPDFQFDKHGQLRPEVGELLKLLPGADADRGGWRRAFWLYSPHARLDGESPAETFARDAQRVIDVAKREFQGDPDARW
jgi:hypothetical protein